MIWLLTLPLVAVFVVLAVILSRRGASMGGSAEHDAALLRGEAINGTMFPAHGGGGRAEARYYDMTRRRRP